MKMMLQGHGIMGFIDGSNPCPPQDAATFTHSVITSELSARPELDEFKVWLMLLLTATTLHDHALMLLLTATLSSSVISCVIGSKSSQEMWVRLQDEFFLPVTRTSIIKLKTDLYNMKKRSDFVSQYLRRLKEARDGLSILGVTFPDEDFVIFALNGLPPKYNTFKCVLKGRDNIISLKDFRAQLLAEEAIVDCSANWNPTNFVDNQLKFEDLWAQRYDDHSQSNMGASTSAPFHRESVLQHYDPGTSAHPMWSHWWARTGQHGKQPQSRNFLERSFKEQEQEEELEQEQEQQLDWTNSHSLSRTRYVDDLDLEAGEFNFHFDDVYSTRPP